MVILVDGDLRSVRGDKCEDIGMAAVTRTLNRIKWSESQYDFNFFIFKHETTGQGLKNIKEIRKGKRVR